MWLAKRQFFDWLSRPGFDFGLSVAVEGTVELATLPYWECGIQPFQPTA